MIVLCGVIAGCDEWTTIEEYAKTKYDFLKTFLKLPNGIPSHDTFGDIFAKIDPAQFEECFLAWTLSVCKLTQGEVIAIDGKTLRGSYDQHHKKAPIHMVSAWANTNRLVLGQVKVDQKSNEITAIPHLIKVLVLKGCIVTIDAMGCQTSIARLIVEAQADYVLALKANQQTLHQQVKDSFEREVPTHTFIEQTNDHGRVEERQYSVLTDLKWIETSSAWAGLCTLVRVESRVFHKLSERTGGDVRYYITSLQVVDKHVDTERIAGAVRGHWGIEVPLHWSLDVSFNEDKSRIRKGYSDQNLSAVRKMGLNLLRHEPTVKRGIKTKRMKAGWDDDYLRAVLHL